MDSKMGLRIYLESESLNLGLGNKFTGDWEINLLGDWEINLLGDWGLSIEISWGKHGHALPGFSVK